MKKIDEETDLQVELLHNANRKLDAMLEAMQKIGVAEYVEMMRHPRRLFWINFWSGIARGLGMAIGFTILAAVVLYFLQYVILLNVPVIGDFIADIVQIVQKQLGVD
ncbi:MAG: DUF5665 domain-containing protein [Syntrophomonadaceae bacterium]